MSNPELGQEDDFNYGYNFDFTEQSVRLGFIRKVYGILCCQLITTILIMCIFLYVPAVNLYAAHNIWLYAVCMAATFVCLIILACCPDVRRTSPMNFIFLGIFTICEGCMLGAVSVFYHAEDVMIAVGTTAIVAMGLTLFAFQTKWDFTMLSGGLLVCVIVLFCFGLFALIFQNRILNIVYASLGALLFSVYLVFDTQLMLGGKHRYSLSPEEYIFAALNLYLDIINLFLFILTIIGNARN